MVGRKDESEEYEDYRKCFVVETSMVGVLVSINVEDDWIVDSSCGHHLTGDESIFHAFHAMVATMQASWRIQVFLRCKAQLELISGDLDLFLLLHIRASVTCW